MCESETIKLIIPGEPYKIVFKRVWHEQKVVDDPNPFHKNDGRYDTKCEIYCLNETRKSYYNIPTFTGIARLHPNDTPDKIVGKKIALRNAIGVWDDENEEWSYSCADFFYKKVRTAIWKAFWGWISLWSPRHEYLYSSRAK